MSPWPRAACLLLLLLTSIPMRCSIGCLSAAALVAQPISARSQGMCASTGRLACDLCQPGPHSYPLASNQLPYSGASWGAGSHSLCTTCS